MGLELAERGCLLSRSHTLFGNCHASTIVAFPDGERLVAFFAGRREGEGDTAVWLCRWASGGWQPPVRTFFENGLAHWNPVLHAQDGRVWLFYKVGPTVHNWTTRVAVSDDAGRSWTRGSALVPGDSAPRGPVKNKLIVLADGTWLAPGSVETEIYWDSFVDRSHDRGKTWECSDVPFAHHESIGRAEAGVWTGLAANALWETNLERVFRWDGIIQPTLWESKPGQVHMLLRSTRGRVFRSDSCDAGQTWCPGYPTSLPNNNSGLDVARIPDGHLVLAYNPVEGNWGRRYPISLAISADDGETWMHARDLETEEGEFSYPAIIACEEHVHITYTWNRTNIVHHIFRMT